MEFSIPPAFTYVETCLYLFSLLSTEGRQTLEWSFWVDSYLVVSLVTQRQWITRSMNLGYALTWHRENDIVDLIRRSDGHFGQFHFWDVMTTVFEMMVNPEFTGYDCMDFENEGSVLWFGVFPHWNVQMLHPDFRIFVLRRRSEHEFSRRTWDSVDRYHDLIYGGMAFMETVHQVKDPFPFLQQQICRFFNEVEIFVEECLDHGGVVEVSMEPIHGVWISREGIWMTPEYHDSMIDIL